MKTDDLLASTVFAINLYRAMRAKGSTQKQIAAAAECHPTYVYRVLHREQRPSIDVADKMARAVGCTLPELLDGNFQPPLNCG